MGWLKNMFSGLSPNETAIEFIAKNLGVQINISSDMAFELIKAGQRVAREMDPNSFQRPRNYIYSSPLTLIGEFNALVEFFEDNEDDEALMVVCQGIILAYDRYRSEFNSYKARMYVRAPTDMLNKAKNKLNVPGIFG